jgi:putative Mn2+ efflux pump MntP
MFELLLIGIGLSMDAFAISITKGLQMRTFKFSSGLIVGLYFGISQALMPLIGYLVGIRFADAITRFDHWIAFALLAIIGGKMVIESLREKKSEKSIDEEDKIIDENKTVGDNKAGKDLEYGVTNEDIPSPTAGLGPAKMLPLAIATSIDALAVGVSFAFLKVEIVPAIAIIGTVTLCLSIVGVKIGNVFGLKFKSKAELVGGLILILIGVKILVEHLGILVF